MGHIVKMAYARLCDWQDFVTRSLSTGQTHSTRHSAYVATNTESNGAKIDGF